jgi:D-glycero-D-manno-heptose 1,7-bisphosphate phosphatase
MKSPHSAAVKLVLMDQNGVLIEDIGHDILKPDDVKLIPGAAKAIARLNRAEIKVAICTNQEVVGRGLIDDAMHDQIQARFEDELAARGAKIDALFVCTDDPERPTKDYKPACGMLLQALSRFGARAADTPMIGDQISDMEAALRAGCQRHLVLTGQGEAEVHKISPKLEPVAIHDDVQAAVESILKGSEQSSEAASAPANAR